MRGCWYQHNPTRTLPTFHNNPHAPSSWLLPELTWMSNLPNVVSVDFNQGMLEAPSQKPTTLLCLYPDHIVDAVNKSPNCRRCNHSAHASVLTGKKPDGSFCSSPARQYPGPMNSMWATVVTDAHINAKLSTLRQHPSAPPFDIHDFVLSPLGWFYVPLDPSNIDQVLGQYGADFISNSEISFFFAHIFAHLATLHNALYLAYEIKSVWLWPNSLPLAQNYFFLSVAIPPRCCITLSCSSAAVQ